MLASCTAGELEAEGDLQRASDSRDVRRYRANVVLETSSLGMHHKEYPLQYLVPNRGSIAAGDHLEPFAEFKWCDHFLQVGTAVLHITEPTVRCPTT